jgi:hypothetical protein
VRHVVARLVWFPPAPTSIRAGRCPPWTEDRVRSELAEFLKDRGGWPTVAEFRDTGRKALRLALNLFGGKERWAEDFDRELRGPQRISRWNETAGRRLMIPAGRSRSPSAGVSR